MGDKTSHDGVTGNIESRTKPVHEPINGQYVGEACGSARGVEHSVVCCDDQNERGRGNRGSSSTSNGGDDDKQKVGSDVGLDAVQDCEPDTSAGEVNRTSIHIDGSSERNDKARDRFGDTASGLDTFEGHGNGCGTTGASKGHGLGGDDMLEVGKGVGAREEEKEADVNKEKLQYHGHDSSDHEVTDIFKGFGEIILSTNGLENERKDSNCKTKGSRVYRGREK